MVERKNLTIIQVKEIQKVGANQIPKLPFRAKDGDIELECFTFRPRLFESIKEGQTITADVETSIYNDKTQYKITQIYVDGQPAISKGTGRSYGKSPEELEQSARSQVLSYAKDCAVAKLIPLEDITKQADVFYQWLKGNGDKPASSTKQVKARAPTKEQEFENLGKSSIEQGMFPTGKKVQNIVELKGLLMKHTIPTHEAKEILSIKEFADLKDLDEAWTRIKEAKEIK